MKRLTLEELKAQKNVVAKLEAIKGGDTSQCHSTTTTPTLPPEPPPSGGGTPIVLL